MTAWTSAALLAALTLAVPRGGAEEPPWSMFDVYEMNRQEGTPNYITEDFLFLAHAMVARRTIADLENRVLMPAFASLTTRIGKGLDAMDETDPAVRLARDFMAVIACLLSGADRPEPDAAARPDSVAAELALIRESAGLSPSELMGHPLDYSRFIVRGSYARSEELGRYFRAMTYAGAVLFPVTASKATGIRPETADLLTRTALKIVETIHADPDLLAARDRLAIRLTWLFGPPDNLTHVDYRAVRREMADAPIADIRRRLLERARKTGRQPLILSGLVRKEGLEPGVSPRDVLTGWRFIPQRYTPDSAAFQQLVYDRVTVYQGDKTPFSLSVIDGKPVKGLPLGLELMAFLGSVAADDRLAESDERNYKGYAGAEIRAKALLDGSLDIPTLTAAHLTVLGQWLDRQAAGTGGPDDDRRLNSALSFWTWTRYITLLYAKQSYTVAGKGLDLSSEDRRTARIEPAPALYEQLAAAAAALKKGVSGGPGDAEALAPIVDRLTSLESVLRRCRRIAAAAADGDAPPTGEDAAFLNNLDKALLKLTGEKDAPIVTDVHTDPSGGRVLQEAIGRPRIVTVPVDEGIARGALFRYYEFKYPLDRRMTDEAWRQALTDSDAIGAIRFSPGGAQTIE